MTAPRALFAFLLLASLIGTTTFAQAALLANQENPEPEKEQVDQKPETKPEKKAEKKKSDDAQKDSKRKSQKDDDKQSAPEKKDKKKSREKSSDKNREDATQEKKRDAKKSDEADNKKMKREEKDEPREKESKNDSPEAKSKADDKPAKDKPAKDKPAKDKAAKKDTEESTQESGEKTPSTQPEKQQGEPTPAMRKEGSSDEETPAPQTESKSALEPKPAPESARQEKPEEKPAAKKQEKKVDRNKFAVTDLAQVDADFWLQGEYYGRLSRPDGVLESAGIQVVARGDGKFIGRQLRGGLPGNGWNNAQKIDLAGQREGDRLTLRHESGYQVAIEEGRATVSNSSGATLGILTKVQRRSKMIGLPPTETATVLFDGNPTDHFVNAQVDENGLLQIGTVTKDPVQDFRLHLEFRLPYMPYATGQARSNSGVYIQERYEVQILDSFGLPGEFNECGSLYRTKPPEVNMCFPPLVWQTYDVYFTAARFDEEGKKIAPARISVLHNGILVQDNYELPNKTGAGKPETPEARPIKLQDHGNPVVFRNVWIERPEEVVEPSSAGTQDQPSDKNQQNDSVELQPAGEPLPRP